MSDDTTPARPDANGTGAASAAPRADAPRPDASRADASRPASAGADAPRGQARRPDGPRAATIPPSQVQFDTSNLKSSYCNVCNGSSTREEVVINFGVNESWDMGREKLLVMLQHRVVMSPYAAKRLRDMMNRLIDEHETKYGKLDG